MTLSPELEAPSNDTGTHDPDTPPQNLSAERSVLGAMMLSSHAISEVVEQLTAAHFFRTAHQVIYTAICDLYMQGDAVDAITVAGELSRRERLKHVGGEPYLHTLIAEVPVAVNAGYYAEDVLDAADRRNIRNVGTRLSALSNNDGMPAPALLEHALEHVTEAVDFRERNGASGALIGSLTNSALENLQAIEAGDNKGIGSGFLDLDRLTNGFHPGQMITIGARPGLGKSSLAMDFLRAAAIKQGYGAIMFNLEMSRSDLMMRLLSAESKVRLGDMRAGTLSDEDWTTLARRMGEIQDAPLVLDDTARLTPIDLASRARKWKRWMESREIELGIIVVDYLQLMSTGRRAESRQTEVSEISRNIKLLAKELEVPIVALSQLNRDSEKRTDRTPQISDLRESGSLEQDSDLVILLHRPDAFERDDPRMGEADLILAKHRNGPTSTINVAHQLHYSRFVDMATE